MNTICKAVIIHCSDHRIQPALNNWLDKQDLLGSVDRISIGAAVKEHNHEIVLENLKLSTLSNTIEEVILVQHRDCGAYHGDESQLLNDIQSLTHKIKSHLPNASVTALLIEPVWAVREIQL